MKTKVTADPRCSARWHGARCVLLGGHEAAHRVTWRDEESDVSGRENGESAAGGERVRVEVLVSKEEHEALGALGAPEEVLGQLAERACDGVTRPGSWERGWLHQAFGDEFEANLEPDPSVAWRQRVKRGEP